MLQFPQVRWTIELLPVTTSEGIGTVHVVRSRKSLRLRARIEPDSCSVGVP